MLRGCSFGIGAACLISGTMDTARAQSSRYTIHQESSLVYAQVLKAAGLFSGLAHNHVIRATQLSGWLELGLDRPGECRASVDVPVRHLLADEVLMRRRVGYDKELDRDDAAEVQATMLGKQQLNAEEFPFIRLRARDCSLKGDELHARGELHLHGVTREYPLVVKLTQREEGLQATGTLRVEQTDHGIEPYSAALGAVKNQDTVTLVFDLSLRRSEL